VPQGALHGRFRPPSVHEELRREVTQVTDARFLSYPVSQSAVYLLFLGTANASEVGAYSFTISASQPLR